MRLPLALAATLMGVAALGCRGDREPAESIARDAAVDVAVETGAPETSSGPDARAVDPEVAWDPVWHQTSPREWPRLEAPVPSCGNACRVALNEPVEHNPSMEHTHAASAVADTSIKRLLLADAGSSVTKVLAEDGTTGDGFTGPQLHGDRLLYVRVAGAGRCTLELLDVRTGERKIVYRTAPLRDRDIGIWSTWLNDKYAFWMRDGVGVMSRNLATGALKVLVPGELNCGRHFASQSGIYCDSIAGKMVYVDQETGAISAVDPTSSALQTDMGWSRDGRMIAWVDYRNQPAGEKPSSIDFHRNGSEIYSKDLVTGEIERLTHDFPGTPRQKVGPIAIEGDLVVWFEQPATAEPNPTDGVEGIYWKAEVMVVLDRARGKRCRAEKFRVAVPTLRGRHVYGYRNAFTDGKTRLVDVDLDDPAIPWDCVDAK